MTALAGIRSSLDSHRDDLSWLGCGLDVAFPRFVPGGLPGRFAERVEKQIDRELARLLRALKRQHAVKRTAPTGSADAFRRTAARRVLERSDW